MLRSGLPLLLAVLFLAAPLPAFAAATAAAGCGDAAFAVAVAVRPDEEACVFVDRVGPDAAVVAESRTRSAWVGACTLPMEGAPCVEVIHDARVGWDRGVRSERGGFACTGVAECVALP